MTIPTATGRQRSWDLEINGYPFPVLRSKGVPVWAVPRVPAIEGQTVSVQSKERHYRSGHSGYGWGQYMAPNTYHYGIDADLRFPGQAMCGPLVTTVVQGLKDTTNGVTGFFELGSYLYTLSGRYINQIDPTTDAITSNATFPYSSGGVNTILTEAELFDGSAFIVNSTLDYLLKWSGSAFTAQTNAPLGSRLTKWGQDPDWVMGIAYSGKGTTCLAWVAQNADVNVAANWTGFANNNYPIGDGTGSVNGLVAIGRIPFVGRSDGLWFLDGLGIGEQRLKAIPVESDNGLSLYVDDEGRVIYPSKSGLYRCDVATEVVEDISPGRGLPDRSGIHGMKAAMAQCRAWLYVAVYDGTDSYIMAGRRREDGEPGFGSMIWHGALCKIAGTKVTAMHLSALTDPPRLWFGLLSGNVAYIRLPSNGDNPLHDSACRFADQADIYYPADDFDGGGMRWQLSDAAVEIEGLVSGSSVQIYERRDRGSWLSIGSTASNGTLVLSPSGDKRFSRCELWAHLVNADRTSTPVIRLVTGKAIRRPTQVDTIRTTVLCYDTALSRAGIGHRYSGQELVDQLESLDSDAPVTLTDWWTGRDRSQSVLVTDVQQRIVGQQGDDPGGLAVDLTMRIINEAGTLLLEDGGQLVLEDSAAVLALE